MLFKITFLSALLFSALYPLCFWISAKNPLVNNFHRFHIAIACVVLSLSTIVFWFHPLGFPEEKNFLIAWSVSLLSVCAFYWNKVSVNPLVVIIPCIAGCFASTYFVNSSIPITDISAFMIILGGAIFCISLYAMNLGHWYLNVSGLALSHLKRTVTVFWVFVAVRFIVDAYLIFTQRIIFRDESYLISHFMMTIEGCLLSLAILFGTVFPLVCLYFVKGTLDVKSTQSATGILYTILCAVVIGDITYKYYFFKYGVVL